MTVHGSNANMDRALTKEFAQTSWNGASSPKIDINSARPAQLQFPPRRVRFHPAPALGPHPEHVQFGSSLISNRFSQTSMQSGTAGLLQQGGQSLQGSSAASRMPGHLRPTDRRGA